MLAAIPSVVFGLWGIFVVIPVIRPAANWLNEYLGFIPFFGTSLSGPGLLPAAIVLAIMVLPTIAAISQDALNSVPYRTKEAAYGMGATHWEVILKVMIPTAAGGIFSAMVLGFGRALGETMALAMLIGNANQVSCPCSLRPNTLAALLASHFPEAGPVEVEGLMYAALVLLAITLVVNVAGIGLALDHAASNLGQSMTDMTATPVVLGHPRTTPVLTHSWSEGRAMRNGMLTIGAWAVALIAAMPLVSVLYMLIVKGGSRLATELFTELPPAGFEMGGGFGNAIVGTMLMVAIAAVIAVPIGVHGRSLPGRARSRQPAWPRVALPVQGADRLSVDSGRRLRLRRARARDGHLFGDRRRRGARRADASDRDAHRRGGHEDGAAQDEGRGASAWAAPVPR